MSDRSDLLVPRPQRAPLPPAAAGPVSSAAAAAKTTLPIGPGTAALVLGGAWPADLQVGWTVACLMASWCASRQHLMYMLQHVYLAAQLVCRPLVDPHRFLLQALFERNCTLPAAAPRPRAGSECRAGRVLGGDSREQRGPVAAAEMLALGLACPLPVSFCQHLGAPVTALASSLPPFLVPYREGQGWRGGGGGGGGGGAGAGRGRRRQPRLGGVGRGGGAAGGTQGGSLRGLCWIRLRLWWVGWADGRGRALWQKAPRTCCAANLVGVLQSWFTHPSLACHARCGPRPCLPAGEIPPRVPWARSKGSTFHPA